ncbi:S8 family peptidase [Blastococcus jejuensis]|uniref:S8 family peptidase n=1 Tax=Blastococcus jejuensis TaxID=351224 RepID=A0ABP6P1B7_9ACTN
MLGVTPESVAVLRCNRIPEESFLRAADLQVLDRFPDRIVVASITDPDLRGLRARLERYAASAAEGAVTEDGSEESEGADDAESAEGEREEGSSADAALKLPRNATYKDLFDCVDEITDYGLDEVITPALAAAVRNASSDTFVSVDVQCWCPEEDEDARRRNQLVREAIVESGGLVKDSTVRPGVGLSLIRATIPVGRVDDLASLDHVRRIDVLPHPGLTLPQVRSTHAGDMPLVLPPSDDAPVIAVIDSGIRDGHPLLAPAVVEASSVAGIADSDDQNGHGTFVASLALYGPLEDLLGERSVQPVAKLISIRVLDSTGQFPEESLWETDLLAALEAAAQAGARIVNVSIGDPRRPFEPPRGTPLGAALDEYIKRTGVVVVVSAGNMSINDYSSVAEPDDYLRELLDASQAGLLDPASSALALTVGGLAPDAGQGAHPPRSSVDIRPLGRPNLPSPVTRVGPGAGEMIKPELVAPAGSFAFDTSLGRLVSDVTVQVLGANALPAERVLALGVGTSLAAPLVTHVAACALAQNAELTGNGIRALMLASVREVEHVHEVPAARDARWAQHRLTGFGRPDAIRASSSTDHRAVLISESSIPVDGVHLYSVALPSSFFESGGWREVAVALAFDPQARATRLDYLASRLTVTAYRGVSLEEVAKAYIDTPQSEVASPVVEAGDDDEGAPSEAPPALSPYRIKLLPSTQWRSRGANQVGRLRFSQRLDDKRGLDLIFAVKSTNLWATPDSLQNYALAIALERDEDHRAIYAELRATIEQAIELTAEIGG